MGPINGSEKEDIFTESNNSGIKTPFSLDISISKKTLLLNDEVPQTSSGSDITPRTSRMNLLKFGSPSAKFKRIFDERDKFSQSVVNSSSGHSGLRERINGVFSKKINWVSVKDMSKQWIRNPTNMALFAWITCVAVSGAILFMVMTGMLNGALPKKSERDVWFEVNNQILNALFTLMCLYQHPQRTYHLILLCRWNQSDIAKLRKIYCKNGTYKPHEWFHMMVVVILLQLNCFAQYALCGLNLGYKRSQRPAIGVGITISVAIGAPAVAGLYTIMSPLGKDYHTDMDEEAQDEHIRLQGPMRRKSFQRRYSFAASDESQAQARAQGQAVESRPKWSGGIFDFWDDLSIAYLSLFCSFCVFGWNMERLGFGNMYVHIATFLLFCMAPFWIFILAAVNIDNEAVREGMAVTGIVLCAFGMLYGGFWRIQMRKRFNLPSYTFCFNEPSVTDCTLWLCCCWCSLAQEVRTGNSYDIVEDKFYIKNKEGEGYEENGQVLISPLPREDGVVEYRSSGPGSPLGSAGRYSPSPQRQLYTVSEEEFPSTLDKDETMIPPSPASIPRGTRT